MERADKVFIVLFALAIVVVLIRKAPDAKQVKQPNAVLMLSEPVLSTLVGPAYLTSNLPLFRQGDDSIPSISIGREDATATGASAV